jgi:hypothetical protein
MNQNAINQASERYENEIKNNYLLKPISKEDVDIINSLVDICKRVNIKGVKEVMENYKINPDREILKQLLDLSETVKPARSKGVQLDNVDDTEKDVTGIYRMIKFNDLDQRRIYQPNIVSYLKCYDEEHDEYGIFINDCDETLQRQPMHSNTLLAYTSEQIRDKDFEMLDEFFS